LNALQALVLERLRRRAFDAVGHLHGRPHVALERLLRLGTVDVVVQNSDGQSSTLSSGLYNNVPPSVSSVSSNTDPAAGGTRALRKPL